MGWAEFALAFAAFFASHSLPLRPPVRAWIVDRIGHRGFGLFFSALSVAILGWLIAAAGRAPHVPVWAWAPWQHFVPLVSMLPVCLMIALAIGSPNPFSFGGANNSAFDPSRPGIVRWTRHPLLVALAIWAAAHMVPNGDLAHLILFGTFALFALLGGRLVDRRKRRELALDWDKLNAALRATSVVAWPDPSPMLMLRLATGVVLYLILIGLHPILFDVSPLP